jgi:hypothetical protein
MSGPPLNIMLKLEGRGGSDGLPGGGGTQEYSLGDKAHTHSQTHGITSESV